MRKHTWDHWSTDGLLRSAVNKLRIDYGYLRKHVTEFGRHIGHQGLIIDVGAMGSPHKDCFDFDRYVSIDIKGQNHLDLVGDACYLPFAGHTADAVICTEVLEHVRHPTKALKEINRVLRQGGHLVLSTPLLNGVHGETDFTRWTAAGLTALLQEAGFEPLQMRSRGGLFSSVGAIIQRAPREILGLYSGKTRKWRWATYYASLLALHLAFAPATMLCTLLDGFDSSKNFTLGYSVLATKNRSISHTDVRSAYSG